MLPATLKPVVRLRYLPYVTLALALVAIACQSIDQLSGWLIYERVAILNGQAWRLLTGHLTHWSADHFLWDVVMFLVLGAVVERRDRLAFILTVVASATAITTALWLGHPEIAEYRGLSGIDSALFTHAALLLHRDGRRFNQPLLRHISVALLMAFAAKLIYEIASKNTLFVDSASAGFVALPAVHVIGGLAGCAVGACCKVRFWIAPSAPTSAAAIEDVSSPAVYPHRELRHRAPQR